ncbi:hypothetical protein TEA_019022 [Camellia sinensis var. sinensis]|uniref:Potassium transporter n=1 Tax=Camellia sinensis var. sinensis TaxID=542762 RepID=A0A4S4ERY9_CAMSN|nr:hypothetical protein TEA_019022 [Camellia sinensis var. sinensis]
MATGLEIEDGSENKGSMWVLEQNLDQPMDEEAGRLKNMYKEKKFSSLLLLRLAFQSLGVVYGDLGTSPLYVFYNTFPHGVRDPEEVIGALSLIIYSLTLVPLLKYVFIVCRANDNGQVIFSVIIYFKFNVTRNSSLFPSRKLVEIFVPHFTSPWKWIVCVFAQLHLLYSCRRGTMARVLSGPQPGDTGSSHMNQPLHKKVGEGCPPTTPPQPCCNALWTEYDLFYTAIFLSLDIPLSAAQFNGNIAPTLIESDDQWTHLFEYAGGTFALYSLLCRHAKIKTIPNQHRTDEELTTYSRSAFHEHSYAAKTKKWLEEYASRKNVLLLLVLVGTCMVIGDGILTPAISVLSAAGGIKTQINLIFGATDVVVVVAVVILVGLFSMQHYGTDKVGWLFAPIVLLWFLLIGGIGIFNIWKYDSSVLKAFSPVYIYRYLRRGGRDGWTSLGGIMLSITGTEALFADLAHFPVSAVQLAFTVVVFPCLLLAYSGQAAYLIKHQDHVIDAFYRSIPGTAVVIVMLATTFLMTLIMLLVWHCHWIVVVIFTALSLVVELTYFSAVLFKINQGGWVPLVIAAGFLVIMCVWHYGTVKRYEFEMHSKVSMAWILGLGPSLGLVRVPGIGLVFTELASGVPRIFSHFITNLPAIHSVVVFVCVKYLPVYTVPEEERFLVKRIGPKNFHMFRCVARYGYRDLHKKDDDFEKKLFNNLFMFVRLESMMEGCSDSDEYSLYGQQTERSKDFLLSNNADTTASCNIDLTISSVDSIVQVKSPMQASQTITSSGQTSNHSEVDELEFLTNCRDAGVVHILGNTVIKASRDSRIYKKIAVDYIYAFLRKICRENSVIFNVPHESLLNVGQIFYV